MRRALTALLVAALLAGLPVAARATPEQTQRLRPLDLEVFPGGSDWRPDNAYPLHWGLPTVVDEGFPITAVNYWVRDARGAVAVPAVRLPAPVGQTARVHLASAGVYTAEVWFEGPDGQAGPPASVALRFDNVPPAPAQPAAAGGWVAAGELPRVRFEHPASPLPISGIRGYAFSVDRGEGSGPCAGADRCTVAETDLRAGAAGDTAVLTGLPEGPSVVRAVAVSGSGLRSVPRATTVWVDHTKPEASLSGAEQGWSSGPVRVTASARDALSGMGADGPAGPFTAIAVDGGLPTVASGDTASAVVAGNGVHAVAFYGRDAAGNSGEESAGVAAVRIDEAAPRVSFADRQDPAEPERVEVEVEDALSGPSAGRGSITLRRIGSRGRFEALPTVVAAGRLVAHWDSDSFPAGTYEFRATGYDAAGNAAASDQRANGTRMLLVNPLKAATRIEAGFGGRSLTWNRCRGEGGRRHCHPETIESFAERPAARTVPYGRGVSIAGQLRLGTGAALAGTPVEIVETFGPGAKPARQVRTVETDADGTFAARLAPGPSRQVEARFPGDRLRSRSAATALRLDVLAGVRLRASTRTAAVGGRPVVFSGRVGDLGAPLPRGGRPVELQFRVSGSGWEEFRTVQTDRRGRFGYRYAFSDDDSRGIRFQFRAYAPPVDGWSYQPAFSSPVFVTGR